MGNSNIGNGLSLKPVAYFHSPFGSKFGIPRQSGVVESLTGMIVFEKEYRNVEGIRGLEGFDYLWMIWGFSANPHTAKGLTVRPPRLGGNRHLGVFATRSPFRPNPLGLSSVRIDRIEYEGKDAPIIYVKGADLMDGTPIYDVKPYIPYTDSHPEARGGFTESRQWNPLEVMISDGISAQLESAGIDIETLKAVLAQDPRPQYHADSDRIYVMPYSNHDVFFRVYGNAITITRIKKL